MIGPIPQSLMSSKEVVTEVLQANQYIPHAVWFSIPHGSMLYRLLRDMMLPRATC